MTTTVIIRPVAGDEHDLVGTLVADTYAALEGGVGDGYRAVLRDVDDRVRSCDVLVAEVDGRVVGSVTYVPGPGPYAELAEEGEAEIRMLAVAPGHEGSGIGRALVEACIARARAAGRRRIPLYTTGAMVRAHHLYERLGFRRVPEHDWQIEGGPLLLCYVLDLRAHDPRDS